MLSWRRLRDRLLADPDFRHWAMGSRLTRAIARRRARALFDLCAGFVYSQILRACIELRLFDRLAEGPRSVSWLAERMALSEDATLRLLEAARALGLVERRGLSGYGLGRLGAAIPGNPGLVAMVEHHALLYADLADPVALLRGTSHARHLAAYWPYAGASGADPGLSDRDPALGASPRHLEPSSSGVETSSSRVEPYTALMATSQAMIAAEILDAYPIHRHRRLLDVGGGDGSFLRAAAAKAPKLRLMLFDLPAVAERARARFAEAGLADRTEVLGGDFHRDPLPRGADLLTLVRVVHDHDDAAARRILAAARRALPDDGTLILAEPMADTPGAEAMGHAYFGFYLLAMGSGRPRSRSELETMLREAGFGAIRTLPTRSPMLTGLVVARPAGAKAPEVSEAEVSWPSPRNPLQSRGNL